MMTIYPFKPPPTVALHRKQGVLKLSPARKLIQRAANRGQLRWQHLRQKHNMPLMAI